MICVLIVVTLLIFLVVGLFMIFILNEINSAKEIRKLNKKTGESFPRDLIWTIPFLKFEEILKKTFSNFK